MVINKLQCGDLGNYGTCGALGGTCDSWNHCAGDRCCSATYTWDACIYEQKSGGTSTAVGFMAAIGELLDPTYGRPDASKVIILATDGSPTGSQQLPTEVSSWCQTQGLQLYSREDTVVCISRYAQSTTAPDTPAEAIGMCPYGFCHKELKAMGATVVTVGVNVAATDTKSAHFKDVASDPSLYIPISDISGAGLDDMILSLIEKSCPPVDCTCKQGTPWGACQPDGTQTNVCVPETLPDFGGAPCVSPTRSCRYVFFLLFPKGIEASSLFD